MLIRIKRASSSHSVLHVLLMKKPTFCDTLGTLRRRFLLQLENIIPTCHKKRKEIV